MCNYLSGSGREAEITCLTTKEMHRSLGRVISWVLVAELSGTVCLSHEELQSLVIFFPALGQRSRI